jgi:biotin carboxyl carrier protein
MRLEYIYRESTQSLEIERDGSAWRITLPDGSIAHVHASRLDDDTIEIRERTESGAERIVRVPFVLTGEGTALSWGGDAYLLTPAETARRAEKRKTAASASLAAPMVGLVVDVMVKEGDTVAPYQPIAVIEAMKVMATVESPFAGTVSRLYVAAGDRVAHGGPIADISPQEGPGE